MGRAARAASSSACTWRSSASSSFSRSDTARTSAIASDASPPSRCTSPIRLLAAFFSARSRSSSGRSERRLSSSSRARSSAATGASPRRARAARTPSGSARIAFRSSTRTASRRQPGRSRALSARVLVEEVGERLGILAGHDVRRHDRPGEASVADRVEDVVASHLAHVEVGAVGALPALQLLDGLGAVGVRGLQRVTARAALVEQRRRGAAVVLDAQAAAGCGGGLSVEDDSRSAATLFNQRCSGCHSLKSANSYGSKPVKQLEGGERTNGPNFNVRKVARDDVLYAIRNGGFSGAIM